MPDHPEQPETPDTPPVQNQPNRFERRETAAANALRTTIRDFTDKMYGRQEVPPRDLELNLRIKVSPENAWALRFNPPLQQQLEEQFGNLTALLEVYVPGHVFCFRCKSSVCEHAVPDSPLNVFAGYNAMGIPQWHALTQCFINARDERIDQLFEKPPRVTARVIFGRELKTEQLSIFGKASRSYSILGQVAAGYFLLDKELLPGNGSQNRVAMTFQFVEIRLANGLMALRLNTLCRLPNGLTLEELYASERGAWIHRAQKKASSELEQIERKVQSDLAEQRKDARDILRKLPDIMRQLVLSLERGHRQSRRRTKHVEQRRSQRRPVHMAMSDAKKAEDDDLLYDEKSNTVIIPGDHGRFHVFTLEGKHVTSFVGKPGAIEFRIRTHRWRPLDEDEQKAFRSQSLLVEK